MSPVLIGAFVGAFLVSLASALVWLIIAKIIPPLRRRPTGTYLTAMVFCFLPLLVSYRGPGPINFTAAISCALLLLWPMNRAKKKLQRETESKEENMFGLGGNRELKDLAHKIGKIFHHQLTEAMESQGEVFNNADEIAFTSGYLKAYFHQMFTHYNNSDRSLEAKLFKKTCDGVIPKRLWDIYLKGEELGQLAEWSTEEHIKQTGQAYEQGIVAGMEDANETHFEGTLPSQLTKYLTNETLVIAAYRATAELEGEKKKKKKKKKKKQKKSENFWNDYS